MKELRIGSWYAMDVDNPPSRIEDEKDLSDMRCIFEAGITPLAIGDTEGEARSEAWKAWAALTRGGGR